MKQTKLQKFNNYLNRKPSYLIIRLRYTKISLMNFELLNQKKDFYNIY